MNRFRHAVVMRRRGLPLAGWLALAAIVYRALLPAGFMPAASPAAGGTWLVLCSAQNADLAKDSHGLPGHAAASDCAFAVAAAPALPQAAPAVLPVPQTAHETASPSAPSAPRHSVCLGPPPRGPPAILV